jgi:hypothetical protein
VWWPAGTADNSKPMTVNCPVHGNIKLSYIFIIFIIPSSVSVFVYEYFCMGNNQSVEIGKTLFLNIGFASPSPRHADSRYKRE